MKIQDELLIDEVLIHHANAVSRLLNDKSVQQVFTDLDAKYVKDWKAAADPEAREDLWLRMRALGDLKFVLEATVQRGQHEAELAQSRHRQG